MKLHDTRRVESCVLIQVVHELMDTEDAGDSLQELAGLAQTAGLEVVGQMVQNRDRPHGGTMLGSGKVAELKELIETTEADTVISDNPLNAIQAFNLGKALGVRVLDRTEIILQIFARRARSAEAQLQVELAQTEFLLQRIPVTESQQRFKGRANVRGPGESHLQLRNQPLRRRIAELKKKLANIQDHQSLHVKSRIDWPVVSLVGYTNAGKSTLLNALAGSEADAYVDDKLFATLDTKTRAVWLAPARRIMLTDTVGFIRNLPHGLVASFKSTLDVAVRADLLLIVVDAASSGVDRQIEVCREALQEIGAAHVPNLLLLNKYDLMPQIQGAPPTPWQYPNAISISARSGQGLDTLKRAIIDELQRTCPLWRLPPANS